MRRNLAKDAITRVVNRAIANGALQFVEVRTTPRDAYKAWHRMARRPGQSYNDTLEYVNGRRIGRAQLGRHRGEVYADDFEHCKTAAWYLNNVKMCRGTHAKTDMRNQISMARHYRLAGASQ